jgi:cytochrome c553
VQQAKIYFFSICLIVVISCTNKIYETNGETIYKTGRNIRGEKLINKTASRIKFVNNCQTCHGKYGDRMNNVSIKFSYLSNANNFEKPYNDSLFFRFIDYDIKSNGTKANIGIIWKMSDNDKKDLLKYLKSL